jgi:L-fuconolactonase
VLRRIADYPAPRLHELLPWHWKLRETPAAAAWLAWQANMAELATCPNVSVKLGGMLNRGAALNFREFSAPPNSAAGAAAWRPYVEPCIELFGAERCNFESNFPVDKMGTVYATL